MPQVGEFGTLPDNEQDVLDGYDYPTLLPNLQDDEKSYTYVDQEEFEKKVKEVSAQVDPNVLLEQLQKMMQDNAHFDPTTGETRLVPGSLSKAGNRLTDEEFDVLVSGIRNSIDKVRSKSAMIKSAIEQRQKDEPTIVMFDKRTKPLLKKGMSRIFKSKAGQITFEHYKAALELRRLLSEMTLDETLKDARRVAG